MMHASLLCNKVQLVQHINHEEYFKLHSAFCSRPPSCFFTLLCILSSRFRQYCVTCVASLTSAFLQILRIFMQLGFPTLVTLLNIAVYYVVALPLHVLDVFTLIICWESGYPEFFLFSSVLSDSNLV